MKVGISELFHFMCEVHYHDNFVDSTHKCTWSQVL